MNLGEPFAAGRDADVFALDVGRVLRRYRTGMDATREAGIMAYVNGLGFPVPEVFEADGTDLIMERMDGLTLAEAALAGEVSIPDGVDILTDLLRRLHELPPRGTGAAAGETIVHLDLHPENVLLSRRGPVVIDWSNAGDGPGDLDTALSALILAQVAIGSIEHPLGGEAGTMVELFLEKAPGDPLRLLDDAAELRRGQPTMTPEEIAQVDAAVAHLRATRRPPGH